MKIAAATENPGRVLGKQVVGCSGGMGPLGLSDLVGLDECCLKLDIACDIKFSTHVAPGCRYRCGQRDCWDASSTRPATVASFRRRRRNPVAARTNRAPPAPRSTIRGWPVGHTTCD